MLPETAAVIRDVRRRNLDRIEKRRENASTIKTGRRRRRLRETKNPTAIEDVQILLDVIDRILR